MTGHELKGWLQRYGVTQARFAKIMGNSQAAVSKLCRRGPRTTKTNMRIRKAQETVLAERMMQTARMAEELEEVTP